MRNIQAAARLDWSAVDPSIFGTLFERELDPATRAQLGAQYTSREDIETLVDPVVMHPLRREWHELKEKIDSLLVGAEPVCDLSTQLDKKKCCAFCSLPNAMWDLPT